MLLSGDTCPPNLQSMPALRAIAGVFRLEGNGHFLVGREILRLFVVPSVDDE